MADQAPVCHVTQDEIITQPSGPSLPSVPQATDLATALLAIQALAQNVDGLSGRSGQQQSAGQRGQAGQAGKPGQAGKAGNAGKAGKDAQKNTRWSETGRTTQKVRVVSTQDSKVFIDVIRTTSITMQDSVTGELMVIRNSGG